MKKYFLSAALFFAAVGLSSCAPSSIGTKFVASKDCHVTVTNVNLAGCDLSKRNLAGDDLQSDDLRNADLSGADLSGANLQGANVKGAILKGVITNHFTICVNAESGPCTKPGLKSPSSANAAQGQ
jgi:uncharacterized protein YjbI with pentapeptide repeats